MDCLESPYEGHAKLVAAAARLNERMRTSKNYLTANALDESLDSFCNRVDRNVFYEECNQAISELKDLGWREKRLAEREIVFRKLEECGAVKRTRGCGSKR